MTEFWLLSNSIRNLKHKKTRKMRVFNLAWNKSSCQIIIRICCLIRSNPPCCHRVFCSVLHHIGGQQRLYDGRNG